jgi:hypothetical protein
MAFPPPKSITDKQFIGNYTLHRTTADATAHTRIRLSNALHPFRSKKQEVLQENRILLRVVINSVCFHPRSLHINLRVLSPIKMQQTIRTDRNDLRID